MSDQSCIALVTVLFNCEKHLKLFFECMGRQIDRGFLLILVDNNSSDGSLASARSLSKHYHVPCEFIANNANIGIASGNNQGIIRAQELGLKDVVLINNDISFEVDLIANIRKRAIYAGLPAWTCLSFRADTKEIWFGGGYLSWWLARGIHYDQKKSIRISNSIRISYAPTCLMYLRMDVFDRIGLMDDRYFVYYDDTDFCKRMIDAGIELTYDPTVSFRHYVGGSSGGEFSSFFLRINTRNKFFYIDKHYRAPSRWIVKSLAVVSKLIQMFDKRKRYSTWQGLREAMIDPLKRNHRDD